MPIVMHKCFLCDTEFYTARALLMHSCVKRIGYNEKGRVVA
jgi:hypothetical protein